VLAIRGTDPLSTLLAKENGDGDGRGTLLVFAEEMHPGGSERGRLGRQWLLPV
jgi:hypothetical protein